MAFSDATNSTHSYPRARKSTPSNSDSPRPSSVLVDCVVLTLEGTHKQTFATDYNAGYSGEIRVPGNKIPALALKGRKLIARRARSSCSWAAQSTSGLVCAKRWRPLLRKSA